jgi:hypothetical protein
MDDGKLASAKPATAKTGGTDSSFGAGVSPKIPIGWRMRLGDFKAAAYRSTPKYWGHLEIR